MPQIKDWLFINAIGESQKPEFNMHDSEVSQIRLFGKIYDDSRRDSLTGGFDDGHRIITSPIREVNWEERFVKTRSGTVYELVGNPNIDYIEWLQEKGEWEKLSKDLLPPVTQVN